MMPKPPFWFLQGDLGLPDPGSSALADPGHRQTGPTAARVLRRACHVHYPDISVFQAPNQSEYEIDPFFFFFGFFPIFSLMCKLLKIMSMRQLNCYSIFFLPCCDILSGKSALHPERE